MSEPHTAPAPENGPAKDHMAGKMARHWKIAIVLLAAGAVIGAFTFPSLRRSVLRLGGGGLTEEQARRELVQLPISTPTDTTTKAQLFWASASSPSDLAPVTMELPLSADPEKRAKQLITTLIVQPPSPAQRTLPADAALLQFYLLPDGTGIADFSDALSMEMPSGILSEEMAVNSIVQTLGANLSTIYRLKILIQGQEADTLAGHLDLSGYFPVTPLQPPEELPPSADAAPPLGPAPALPAPPGPAAPAASGAPPARVGASAPSAAVPAPDAADHSSAPAAGAPSSATGK